MLADFLGEFSAPFGGRKKSGFIPKMDFDCQSQPKGFIMRLTQEAIEETEISLHVTRQQTLDTTSLKRIIRDGLAAFEKDLRELTPDNREEVLSLYLNKTRKLLFIFHLALCSHNAKARFRKISRPSREVIRLYTEHYDRESRKLAQLYQLL
jgi:hypothetical protein